MEQAATQKAIDVSNLRLYARLFREYQWEDKVLHWSVFEATLNDIAGRIEADTKAEAAHARSRCQRCGCCLDRNEGKNILDSGGDDHLSCYKCRTVPAQGGAA